MSTSNSMDMNKVVRNVKNMSNNYINIILIVIVIIILVGYMVKQSIRRSTCVDNNNSLLKSNIENLPIQRIRSLQDDSMRLRDYYVMSSFNSCTGGDFVDSCVDSKPLSILLQAGVRFLDFEIYSIENIPVVAASDTSEFSYKSTFNSVPFEKVITTIRDQPNLTMDPLFIHLRVHTNNTNAINDMHRIIVQHIRNRLYSNHTVDNTENFGNTPISELRGRIIIFCQKNNSITSSKLHNITNAYTETNIHQLLRYFDVRHSTSQEQLIELNRIHNTIVIPDKSYYARNFDSNVCFDAGCQFITMSFQHLNVHLKEYVKRFNEYGSAFMIKPEKLRYKETPIEKPTEQRKEVGLSQSQTTEIPGGTITIG